MQYWFIKQTWSWPSFDKIWRYKQKKHLIVWFNRVILGIHDIRVKSRLGDVVVQPCAYCEQRNPAPTPVQPLCEAGTKNFRQKGTSGGAAPSCCEQQGQLCGRSRFLRVLSHWDVKIPRMKSAQPVWVISSTPWLSCRSAGIYARGMYWKGKETGKNSIWNC